MLKINAKVIEKLLLNLNKKHKLEVLRNAYKKVYSVDVDFLLHIHRQQSLLSNYRITDAIARYCMIQNDKELYPLILPSVEKIRSLSPYSRGALSAPLSRRSLHPLHRDDGRHEQGAG